MADALVFHLTRWDGGYLRSDTVLRYAHDSRCTVDRGDTWTRTASDGGVTPHPVTKVRRVLGVRGEEIHAFMIPKPEPALVV